jgi:2-hydroxychromene-2-carboxylate isomerase
MLEPKRNPTPSFIVDPPGWLRMFISKRILGPEADASVIQARRAHAEVKRVKRGEPHVVDYFHQLDDPYSLLASQVLQRFAERYDVELRIHLIRATGGKSQPEFEKLATWARRDAELIAPYLGLAFPADAPQVPDVLLKELAGRALVAGSGSASMSPELVAAVSHALWAGDEDALAATALGAASSADLDAALDKGSALLARRKHYSGATFYYGGEWYWGVDRLYHLEERLRNLGACKAPELSHIAPRPQINLEGIDARNLVLDFYPSLNSPYTAIVYDETIALKEACSIGFNHKPVLPMVMRGVPAPMNKGRYIVFDAKREADSRGVPFGNLIMPIGAPTRRAYSLFPWAMELGKDEALMSSLLRHAFALGVGLHTEPGMRRAVEGAGLDWSEAQKVIDTEDWKPIIEAHQGEMVEGLGLWGVPSFRLSGLNGQGDLAVWGQDRLWLVAAEIKRHVNELRKCQA